jgi:hypothetical protein
MSGLTGNPVAVELAERGDIPGAVAAQMASAKRNGAHPDGVERVGRLFLVEIERVLKRKVTQLQWEAGLLKLEQHGAAGKAVADGLRLEVLEDQMEQLALDPRVRGEGIHSGRKAFAGLAREKRRALRKLIVDIGGYAPDGYANDLLDFDGEHVERAMELTRGEVEPHSDVEREALASYRANAA